MSSGKQKKQTKKRSGFTFFKYFLLVIILVGILGTGATLAYVNSVLGEVTAIDPSRINDLLTENSVVLDSEGRVLEQIQNQGLRTIVTYDQIGDNLINAFVAVEDKTFFEHRGFNFVRLVGSVVDSVTSGERIKGTSTITQQLARNLYLAEIKSVRTIERKIKEAYYALQLEKHLKKEQIIESYLNTIYLGSSSNGVEAAAQTYFDKEAKDLDLVESAMLAGIPANPLRYSPMITKKKEDVNDDDYIIDNSDPLYTVVYNASMESRYQTVIYLMRENGYISEDEYQAALEVDLKTKLNYGRQADEEITSYFADMVKDDVINDLMATYGYTREEAQQFLYTSGVSIHSTIDFDMQKTLEGAYSGDNLTPYFGEPTYAAVRAFQKQYGLQVDGIIGSGTLEKMADLGLINMDEMTESIYRRGMEKEEIVSIKKALKSLDMLKSHEYFPKVTITLDGNRNIVSEDSRRILLYPYDRMVNESGQLVIPESDYRFDDRGNLILTKNRRLNFYDHYENNELSRIQIVVKNTYTYDADHPSNTRNGNGSYNVVDLYSFEGRDVLIPDEFKRYDDEGNVVVDAAFFEENEDFYTRSAEGNLLINEGNYIISQSGVIQPQSSMVIIDYRTGELKAIVGGRNIAGQKIYNRALNPRQPGSSIKPLAVYTPAIHSKRYTAATPVDDIPTYLGGGSERWPLNWYEHASDGYKYWGLQTVRNGIEYSLNVVTAKIANDLGIDMGIEYLERFGITTLVKEGRTNDMNLSAISLGGMTRGIKPIELTAAYGALANDGVLVETITYTHVTDSNGDVILEKKPKKEIVVDEKTAYILTDMMRSGVTGGLSTVAQIRPQNQGIPVAGKTGTTSNKLDAWFAGYTPYYVATVWFGSDENMPLDQGSKISAQFWSMVMKDLHANLEDQDFVEPDGIRHVTVDTTSGKLPSDLSRQDPRGTIRTELFLPGTEPRESDDVHVLARVDIESGKLATEYCPEDLVKEKVFVDPVPGYNPQDHLLPNGNPILTRDHLYRMPTEECDLHTGELIDIFDQGSYSGTTRPIITFPDGSKIIQIPLYADLVNGQKILLPVGTRILVDGSLSFPNGTLIEASEIRRIHETPAQSTTDQQPQDSEDLLDQMDQNADE
jgi:membrane peptidoglycan carboxypeptidase